MLSYCLKCRKIGKVKIQVARIKLLSKCAVCDSKKSKFPKQQEPSLLLSKLGIKRSLTLFMMDIFETAHGWGGRGGGKKAPFLKICHTYPTTMKLCSCTLPKEDQKIYESYSTPLTSADITIFHRKSANFVISKNTGVDCILVHNF